MSPAPVVLPCPRCGKKNRIPATASGVPRCANCHGLLPWVAHADDGSFTAVAEQAQLPVLVDFWATWCGPCRMVSPELEKLASERAGQLKLVKVDVDHSPLLSAKFSVQAVPTLMIMDSGTVIARQAGAAPIHALRAWFDTAISQQDVEAKR